MFSLILVRSLAESSAKVCEISFLEMADLKSKY